MPLNYAGGGAVTEAPKAIEATPKAPRVLTLADRCDACFYATAFVRVYFMDGELDFCKHHWDLYRDHIGNAAVDFTDETEYINEKLDVSA